jgi:beta-phosphoglucomutase-like phosphatase (HAD superfamily)
VGVIKAVVFDMDGVLIDSEPVWERVRRNFVATRGGQWRDDAQDRLMGMSTAEWSAYLSEDFGLRLAAPQVAELVIAAMAAEYRAHLPLLPGAVGAVRDLSARWPLAVASSAPKSLIDAVLDASGLRPAFAAAVSSEEVARGKPAPDVYLEAAARLGVPPAARAPPSRTPPTACAPRRRPAWPSSRSPARNTRRPPGPWTWPGWSLTR